MGYSVLALVFLVCVHGPPWVHRGTRRPEWHGPVQWGRRMVLDHVVVPVGLFYADVPVSAVVCLPACLRVRRSFQWPGPPRERVSTTGSWTQGSSRRMSSCQELWTIWPTNTMVP